jgi:hypothetical protein
MLWNKCFVEGARKICTIASVWCAVFHLLVILVHVSSNILKVSHQDLCSVKGHSGRAARKPCAGGRGRGPEGGGGWWAQPHEASLPTAAPHRRTVQAEPSQAYPSGREREHEPG